MENRIDKIDAKNATRLYECMTAGERMATFRFLRAIEAELTESIEQYENIRIAGSENIVNGQLKYWRNCLSAIRWARFRTGIKDGDLLDA